jgi:hypothetical protein
MGGITVKQGAKASKVRTMRRKSQDERLQDDGQ